MVNEPRVSTVMLRQTQVCSLVEWFTGKELCRASFHSLDCDFGGVDAVGSDGVQFVRSSIGFGFAVTYTNLC